MAPPRAPKLVPVVHSKLAKTDLFIVNVGERLPRKYVVSTQRRRSNNIVKNSMQKDVNLRFGKIEPYRIHKGTWSMIQTMMMII